MKFSKQDTNIAKTAAIIMMYIHHLFFWEHPKVCVNLQTGVR